METARTPTGRPKGVTLLSVWSVIVGLSIAVLAVVAVYGIRTIPEALAAFLDAPEALVAIAFGVTGVHLVMAYGLWNLRPWARVFAIGFAAVGILFGMFTLPLGFASVLYSLATVWYLSEQRVRAAFVVPDPAAKGAAK